MWRPAVARRVSFEARHDRLQRHARLADGSAHPRACTREVLEQVAWYAQEHPGAGVTAGELWRGALAGLPLTQINVALDFLAEWGCVDRVGRRTYPADSATLYEDALGAFYHLAEVGD